MFTGMFSLSESFDPTYHSEKIQVVQDYMCPFALLGARGETEGRCKFSKCLTSWGMIAQGIIGASVATQECDTCELVHQQSFSCTVEFVQKVWFPGSGTDKFWTDGVCADFMWHI